MAASSLDNREKATEIHNELVDHLGQHLKPQEFIRLKKHFSNCPLTPADLNGIQDVNDLFERLTKYRKIDLGSYETIISKLKVIDPQQARYVEEQQRRIQEILNEGPPAATRPRTEREGDLNASQMVSRLPSQSLSQAPVFTQTQRVKQEKTTPPSSSVQHKSSPAPLSVKAKESPRTRVSGQGHRDTATTSKSIGQSDTSMTSEPKGQSSLTDRLHNSIEIAASPSPKKKPVKSKLSPTRRSPRSRSPSPAPDKGESLNLRSRSPVSPVSKRLNLQSSPVREIVTDTSASQGPFAKKGGKCSPKSSKNNRMDIVVKKEKVVQEPKSRPGKRQIIEDDSDEDYGLTRKSKRKRDEVQNEDDPFDWSSRKGVVKETASSNRGLKKERDEDVVIMDSESETESNRGQRSMSSKGHEVRVSDSDSDSGTKWAGKGKNRSPKGRKVQQTKGIVEIVEESQKTGKKKLDDSSEDEDIGQRSRVKVKEEPGINSPATSSRGRHTRMEEPEDEQTGRQEMNTKQERITPRKPISDRTSVQGTVHARTQRQENGRETPSVPGFLSAVRGQAEEEDNYHGNYVKEEGVPTDLVQTVFVDFVTRRPSQPQNSPGRSERDVPAGYSRWKGCIVKNFKKFKKAGVAGLDRLPNIIGGSDLVPHVISQRRELDEWFKEAQQAESQQSEANRRAQELFEWEPRSHSSNQSR